MALVLGIDSSTQSTKALLVDADDGTVVDQRTAPHPPGTEVDPRAWLTRRRRRRPPGLLDAGRRRRRRRPAARHGRARRGRRAGARRPAVERHPVGAGAARDLIAEMGGPAGVRRRDRQRAGRVVHRRPSCAGCATTNPTAPRGSTGCCSPTTTSRRHLRRPGHRRRSPTAATPPAPATSPPARAPGDPTCSSRRWVTTPRLPRVVAPGDGRRPRPRRAGARRAGTGDNMAAALGLDLEPGDVAGLDRHLRRRLDGEPDADRRRDRRGHRLRRRHRRLPADGHHHERRRHPRPPGRAGSASTTTGWPRWPSSRRPAPDGVTLLPYYGGERTPNRPGRRRHLDRPHPAHHPRRPRPGRRTRRCCARSPTRSTRWSRRPASSPRRLLLVGGAARSPAVRALAPPILGRAGRRSPPPAEYVALGAARQAAWALSGSRRAADVAAARRPSCSRPSPPPPSASGYAALRDRTAHWTDHREGTA